MASTFKNLIAARLAALLRPPSGGAAGRRSAGTGNEPSVDSHQTRITQHFQGKVAFEGTAPVIQQDLLLLAFTNRSGSNMLADYLRQTRRVTGMGEFLNYETTANQSTQNGRAGFPDYIAYLAGKIGRDGLHFGVKASVEQLHFLQRWRIPQMFRAVRVVHIHRDDLLAQAVSHWIASQTKQWTSLQESVTEEVSTDPAKILPIIEGIAVEDEAIRLHCTYADLPYLSVSYEEVLADVTAAMTRVGALTGIDVSACTFQAPRIRKQADDRNDRIMQEVRQYLSRR